MNDVQTNQTLLEQELHQLRQEIDAVIKKADEYKLERNQKQRLSGMNQMQREISLVYTKLQEAKMWTGECLEAIRSSFTPGVPEVRRVWDEAK